MNKKSDEISTQYIREQLGEERFAKVENLIRTVEDLSTIQQVFEKKSLEIKQKTAEYLTMVCTEETVKIVKAARAELNNEKKEFEAQRIAVKNKIMEPYNAFEKIYKSCITDIYADTDAKLKVKIDEVEDIIKTRHADEVRAHFESYLADFPQIDFLTFERVGLNITKSAPVATLKQQCEEFVNKVADDLEMIALQPDQAEILVEYIPTLNAAQAITTVAAKRKAIEAQKAAIEAQKQAYIPAPPAVYEKPTIVWVQFENDQGDFAGQEYSYLIPDGSSFLTGEQFKIDTKHGPALVQITRFGLTKDVPAHIQPFLKALPIITIDDYEMPAFDPSEFAPDIPDEVNERGQMATYRFEVHDTVGRIDALQELMRKMGYEFHEC